MSDKTIWLVTHGATCVSDRVDLYPDPAMTAEGTREILGLKPVLLERLGGVTPQVHCGVGRRQWQVSCVLGFNDPKMVFFSSLWGDASTMGMAGSQGEKCILLSHKLLIPYDRYLSAQHGGIAIRSVIASLPENSLICSGRPVLLRLGMELNECRNGALYALRLTSGGGLSTELVHHCMIWLTQ